MDITLRRAGGDLGSILVFDTTTAAWTDVTASVGGTSPSARSAVGMASVSGKIFVHGGRGSAGPSAPSLFASRLSMLVQSGGWQQMREALEAQLNHLRPLSSV